MFLHILSCCDGRDPTRADHYAAGLKVSLGYNYFWMESEQTLEVLTILNTRFSADEVSTYFNMYGTRFSQPCLWRVLSSGILTPCIALSQPTFRRNMWPPSSGQKNKSSKKPAWKQVVSRWRVVNFEFWLAYLRANGQPKGVCLPHAFSLVSCLTFSSTLKFEATCSSETSVDFQLAIRRYIQKIKNKTLQILTYFTFNIV
jgi:hypothetical protein